MVLTKSDCGQKKRIAAIFRNDLHLDNIELKQISAISILSIALLYLKAFKCIYGFTISYFQLAVNLSVRRAISSIFSAQINSILWKLCVDQFFIGLS